MPPKRQAPVEFTNGPFLGMRFSARIPADPRYAYLIGNMLPIQRGVPSPLVAVPPPARSTFTTGIVQWIGTFREVGSAGDTNVAVISGEIWDMAPSATSWTKRVSTANLTTGGITLNATGDVYAVQFGNKLVVSDGTHTPFIWDGTAGAGGLTLLANAPVFYGRPTVYYAKLFGIKNTDRQTIVWSEENSPTTGYEAGGFNNAWTLTQSGSGNLIALLGTNGGLYYSRADSIGLIRGAVTTDFAAAGVHDDVSTEIGAGHTESMELVGDDMWVVDRQGRPYVFSGAGVNPVWQQVGDIFEQLAGDYTGGGSILTAKEIIWLPGRDLVAVHWPFMGCVIFDAHTKDALCFWVPPQGTNSVAGSPTRMGQMVGLITATINKNAEQIGVGYNDAGSSLYAVDRWPVASASDQWPAFTVSSAGPLPVVVTPALGLSPTVAYSWTDAVVQHYLGADTLTPPSANVFLWVATAQTVAANPALPTFRPSILSNVGSTTVTFGSTRQTSRTTWGLLREGRQIYVGVDMGDSDYTNWPSPWGIQSITVLGRPMVAHPKHS